MIRGTTAQFRFKLPYSCTDLSTVQIAFWQTNNKGIDEIIVTKKLSDCSEGESNTELSVTLEPWETVEFSDERKAYTQLKGRTKDGHTFASYKEQITVYPMTDGITGDVIIPPPSDDDLVFLDGGSIARGW